MAKSQDLKTIDWIIPAVFWTLILICTLWLISFFKPILMPFSIGLTIAYLLYPVTKFLSQGPLSYKAVALSLLFLFFITLGLVSAFAVPAAFQEMGDFIREVPDLVEQLLTLMQPYYEPVKPYLSNVSLEDAAGHILPNIGQASTISLDVFKHILSGGAGLLGTLSTFILTPIVAAYALAAWPNILEERDRLIPPKYSDTIRELLRDIDRKIAGFIRGQLTIAVSLGLFYAIALKLAGLNYGFFIGFLAGLFSLVPFLGAFLGFAVSALIAWFQMETFTYLGIIAGIYTVGQIIEGYILTPRLMSQNVQLHPLWIIFALMAGGMMLGILGMFLAVPVAASISVLLGFAIKHYKNSNLYKSSARKT